MSVYKFAVCLFLTLLSSSPLLAAGVLDRSFGNNGQVRPPFVALHLLIQPDNKIIVAGLANSISTVARYNQDGSLDTTFGVRGLWSGFISDVELQTDGKILIAGRTQVGPANQDYYSIVMRLNSDGSVDVNFGNMGGSYRINRDVGQADSVSDVVSLPDGKVMGIIVSSRIKELFCLTADGLPDDTFGNQGFLAIDSLEYSGGILKPVANNKFLLGFSGRVSTAPPDITRIRRINIDGTTDTSFGNNGLIQFEGLLFDIAVQPDGKFITAGDLTRRFLSDGAVDPTFRVARKSYSIALLPDGRFVTTGDDPLNSSQSRVLLLQNNRNELIGKAKFAGGDVAVQSDGKILVSFGFIRYRSITSLGNQLADLDADEKTDISVYRPSSRTYYFLKSQDGFQFYTAETPAAAIFPEDYNADFRSDLVWWSGGCFYGFISFEPPTLCRQWGFPSDIPLGGDYDGDNKSDLVVFRAGFWHILQSATQTYRAVAWGFGTDKPVPADYDADGKTDIAVFRPSNGTWHILKSDQHYLAYQFGFGTDKPVPADYDGDGSADVAVYRPSNGFWYLLKTSSGFTAMQFGASEDRPVPGDYDGDGLTDVAVWRPSNGYWYLLQSAHGFRAVQWGQNGDVPLSTAYSAY